MTDSTRSSTASDVQTDTHTAAALDPAEDGGSVTLLHVEPDARSAELLAAFADRFADGFAVRSVDGTVAALDAVDAVDAVVTEQRLPDSSGVDLVERLRERGSDVPVVFHTTCRENETEARALEAGADAYFSKRSEPGQYDRILERLRGLVDDDAWTSRTQTTITPDTPGSSAGAPPSKE
ncbi:response regulator [Halorubrum sp. Boch-26]|uniref:response regulator n=1 Tax=Halorubrum sp. Boch-26 TaxID=2994426 RepID=UPI00246899E7|nr:response regulator [Halorubrum sp. Boch-26]